MLSDYGSVLCLVLLFKSLTVGKTDGAQDLRNPAPDFSRHSIVQPVVLHGRTKREISATRDMNEAHHPEVTMSFPINDEDYIFDLRLNQDLITDNHILSYQDNGRNVLYKPKKKELDFCHYSGSVRDKPGSYVAVSTCHGIQGIVFDGERMRYIEPAQDGGLNSQHYVYDHSDLIDPFLRRYVSNEVSRSTESHHMKRRISRLKRSAYSNIHEPYNANEKSHYVELALVADSGVYKANKYDKNAVHHKMLIIANYINALFSALNIFVALVGVEVWKSDQIVVETNASYTLANFVPYRNDKLMKNIPHDNAQLLVQQHFNGTTVGLGYIGSMCSRESCAVANNHTQNIGLLAMTIAHEMGHNFGMLHDEICECKEKNCIMNPYSHSTTHWSSCSVQTIKSRFSKERDYLNNCLRNKPKSLFESPTCGNGFVEPGEQCDCGTMAVAGAYSPCHACCDPNTCLLRANATCGAGMCCDLQTCRLKSRGTICRAAQECDLPEYCDGVSEYCPDDVYVMDATHCKEQGMMCMNKKCVDPNQIWNPKSLACPSGCSGRGVCNSKGHCHCDAGYGPPNCAVPGPGGSYDSGPATDTTSSTKFMIAMYALFLGIVPALLVAILIFVSRHNILQRYKDYYQRRLSAKSTEPPRYPPTDGSAGVACNSPLYANVENIASQKSSSKSISLPIQNKRKMAPPKPDRNINKDKFDLTTKTELKVNPAMVKTTPNVHKMSNEKPNATDSLNQNHFNKPSLQTKPTVSDSSDKSDFQKAISLVKLKPITNNSSNENLPRNVKMRDAKSESKTSNLSKEKPNTATLTNENELKKVKPPMKPKPDGKNMPIKNSGIKPIKLKPNVNNLSKENSSLGNMSNENEPKAKPSIKLKPNVVNQSREKTNASQFLNDNNHKVKLSMKPKPNASNLSRENEPKPGTVKGLVSTMNEKMTNSHNDRSKSNIGHYVLPK